MHGQGQPAGHGRPPGARWVYDHPYFMILNMAVGGEFPGSPDETTVFPYSIAIDWVRVSARQAEAGAPTD